MTLLVTHLRDRVSILFATQAAELSSNCCRICGTFSLTRAPWTAIPRVHRYGAAAPKTDRGLRRPQGNDYGTHRCSAGRTSAFGDVVACSQQISGHRQAVGDQRE